MSRKLKNIFKKRVVGLVMLSVGVGMCWVLFIPSGIYILAAIMLLGGFYLLFLC